MSIEFFIQLIINGIFLGAFYATMALGFSTIWGVMRLINLAHGEFLMMGAFVAWYFYNPTREQSLTIASSSTPVTVVVSAALVIFLGLIISQFDVVSRRIANFQLRRMVSILAVGVVFVAILLYWNNREFQPFDITMTAIIFIGLALTLGFQISHLVLGRGLQWGTLWQRRLIGYTSGILLSALFYGLWHQTNFTPIDPFLSLPIVFILFFGLGYILQNGFLNRLVEGPYLTMLLVTFALSIALQNIGLQIYAADPRRINVGYSTGVEIARGITVPPTRVLMSIVAIIMVVGLVSFLRYTRIGYAIRAAAQNKMAAKLMGINIHEVYAITFGVSLALTGMAGAMMGIVQPITPVDGPEFTLRAFAIVALGGLGKVQGVVVGGLVLGIAESLVGGYVNTGWAVTVAFLLLVVMLVVRPQGITGGLVTGES